MYYLTTGITLTSTYGWKSLNISYSTGSLTTSGTSKRIYYIASGVRDYYFTSGNQFTKYRNSYACDAQNSKIFVTDNLIPYDPQANTIYIIFTGTYPIYNSISFAGNCSTIAGSGSVIYSGWTTATYVNNSIIYTNSKNNIIIDNIDIDVKKRTNW